MKRRYAVGAALALILAAVASIIESNMDAGRSVLSTSSRVGFGDLRVSKRYVPSDWQ